MRFLRRCLLLSVALIPCVTSGCFNPLGMGIATPLPVPPWVAENIQERIENQSDHRTPILPPIPPGYRPIAEDPPDRAEILRAMPRVTRGVPFVFEEHRDDIEFTVQKIGDTIDPPRFFPLVGPAQVHHCHWMCTVYYTEVLQGMIPFPFQTTRRRVVPVYIDKDHLHMCISGADAQATMTRDMSGPHP
jgi:hypothetical protein